MNLVEEKQLLQKIRENPRYFGQVFDEYYKPIFNYIFRRIVDYDIARDIAADTFLKAYLNIQSFTWKGIPVITWLYRIATNEVNYHYRKKKSVSLAKEMYNSDVEKLFRFEDYQTEKQLLENELKLNNDFSKIQRCLKDLEIKYQEVLSLRYFEKKSILEIAAILNRKEGTIKSLISRGLEKLKIKFLNAT
jgi:RNA polymerase sigma-70 factor (ECF subfamily)